jgi:hypothetical protein
LNRSPGVVIEGVGYEDYAQFIEAIKADKRAHPEK